MVEEKWSWFFLSVWADNWLIGFPNEWGIFTLYVMKLSCFGWFVTLLYFAFPCSSCQPSLGHSSCSFIQLLFSWCKERSEGKGMGRESWKTVNDANASVHKCCKALIIQDAANYPNYTNSTFLTLLLRKTFFTVHGLLKCWRKSYLREIKANTISWYCIKKTPELKC